MKSCYGRIVTWSALRKSLSERGLFLTTRNFEVEDNDEESICAAYIYRVQPWAHTY